jgi:thiamine biosynthesis protein ThiS
MQTTISITLNGELTTTTASTLAELVQSITLPSSRYAVEHNGRVCPKSQLSSQALGHGDRVEVVGAVGGG